MSVSARVQWDLRKRAALDTTWMAKYSELRESPNVLYAFSKQELTMKVHAQGFCQVLSSEGFIFLVFFFRGAGLETWWVVNQKHNKLHYLLKIRLSCFKHWVTTWNETPSCRWGTGWLHNPGRQLLFFLMKQPRLWFYGHSWVWERHRSASLRWNRLMRVLPSALLLFPSCPLLSSSFIPQQRRNWYGLK